MIKTEAVRSRLDVDEKVDLAEKSHYNWSVYGGAGADDDDVVDSNALWWSLQWSLKLTKDMKTGIKIGGWSLPEMMR